MLRVLRRLELNQRYLKLCSRALSRSATAAARMIAEISYDAKVTNGHEKQKHVVTGRNHNTITRSNHAQQPSFVRFKYEI